MTNNHCTPESYSRFSRSRSKAGNSKPRRRNAPRLLERLEERRLLASDFELAMALGSGGNDMVNAVAADAAGNMYITGRFNGTVDFDKGPGTAQLTSAGGDDVFVAKYTSNGGLVWARQFGAALAEQGFAIAVDATGNVYTTGEYSATVDFDPGTGVFSMGSGGGRDIFISKLDANGNFVWARRMGAFGGDQGLGIAVDGSGNVITTGRFFGTVDFDPNGGVTTLTSAGDSDIFVSKLNSAGNFMWARRMGSTDVDAAHAVTVGTDGSIYATGRFVGAVDFNADPSQNHVLVSMGQDAFVLKLAADGSFVHAFQLGGSGADAGHAIAVDAAANMYVSGLFNGSNADFDPGSGSFVMPSNGMTDAFVARYNSAGGLVWARQFGANGSDAGNGIAVDAAGNVYTTGRFTGSVDFDPGADAVHLVSAGSNEVFVSKLDANGQFMLAKQLGGTSNDMGLAIAADASGNHVYVAGSFEGTADFDPGPGVFNLVSAGFADGFVWKLNPNQSPSDMALSNQSVAENSAAGTLVGVLSASDPDAADSHSFTLLNDAGGRFALVGDQLVVANGSLLDFESGASHQVLVRATDSGGLSFDRLFSISVSDVNETPTAVSLAGGSVHENSAAGTPVGDLSAADPDAGDSHVFTLLDDAGGRFTISGSQLVVAAGSALDFESSAGHSVTVRATDSGGLWLDRQFTVAVLNVNEPPVVQAPADQSLSEGSNLTGSGSFTDPEPFGWTATVDYGDGSGSQALQLAADGSFNLSHVYGDNGTYNVTVYVTDADGAVGSDSLVATVSNATPQVDALNVPATAVRGQPLMLSAAFSDPGALDTHVTLWQVFDEGGNLVASGSGASLEVVLDQHGVYSVEFTVTDDDGASAFVTQSVAVVNVAVLDDPLDESRQMIVIGGTDHDDHIEVTPGYTRGTFHVIINGVSVMNLSADEGRTLSRIVVFGGAGDDHVVIAGSIDLAAWLHGEAGDDHLKGGGGHDLLFGGDNNDLLIGGGGRDLMVGGRGADRLVGNAGDDILLAGWTEYEGDDEALLAIMTEWQRADRTYAQRVHALEEGVGSGSCSIKLNSNTVQHDASVDMLTGSSGLDWFWSDAQRDKPTDKKDEIVSGHSGCGWIITLYTNILGRAPSLEEWNNWVKAVDRGVTFKQVAEAFMFSRERRGKIIDNLYRQYLGRASDDAGVDFWIGVWNAHGGPEHVQAGIIGSKEFYRFSGNTDRGWVSALYKNVLNREVDEAGIDHWVKYIKKHSKQSVVLGFVTSDEYRLGMVNSWFSEYLGRDLDKSGAQHWLKEMKGGLTQESIQIGICSSAEYRSPV